MNGSSISLWSCIKFESTKKYQLKLRFQEKIINVTMCMAITWRYMEYVMSLLLLHLDAIYVMSFFLENKNSTCNEKKFRGFFSSSFNQF
jgi:hypothetical protein